MTDLGGGGPARECRQVSTIRRLFGNGAWLVFWVAMGALSRAADAAVPGSIQDLQRLSIDELLNVEITSVFKRPEPLSQAPAAVFVISNEDIRRSGALSLAEALRLAPNLQVARTDSPSFAITARGFNGLESSNKLLVLIDGRSVYTPLHSGVLWDQEQVFLDDIERIEVISGPAGTLWGANAVNGVINVITKSSHNTIGGLVNTQLGSIDHGAAARYGLSLGQGASVRFYGLDYDRGETLLRSGRRAGDDWDGNTGGFRADIDREADRYTLQGNYFENSLTGRTRTLGGNLLGRWTRTLGPDSTVEVQSYLDTAERELVIANETVDTFDISAQHSFKPNERHQVVWGGGYRRNREEFNVFGILFVDPAVESSNLFSLFVQDTIALRSDLTLTLGIKAEHGVTGPELMPGIRLGWQATTTDFVWSAISRAVRTPSRIDRNLVGNGIVDRVGDNIQAEELTAFELGYRGQVTPVTSLSATLFLHDYDNLRALRTSPDSGRLMFGNVLEGHTYGAELWGRHSVTDWWRLGAGLNLLQKRLGLDGTGSTASFYQHRGNDPQYQVQIRSSMNLREDVEFDIGLRTIDQLPDPRVSGYFAADARLGWHVTDALELSIAGFNLIDAEHAEGGTQGRGIRRSAYFGIRWRF